MNKIFYVKINTKYCYNFFIIIGEIKEIVVPAFAESVSEGDVRWEKKIGDLVKEDDVLCEIETDKVNSL